MSLVERLIRVTAKLVAAPDKGPLAELVNELDYVTADLVAELTRRPAREEQAG